MAIVHQAFDTRLKVWRAVKIISVTVPESSKLQSRFLREARAMAALDHPHVVRVVDVEVREQHPYLVMELVRGGSLVDWLDRWGAMPPAMAVEAIRQTAVGVQEAHRQGLVHRDLKPHNVLITETGQCKVTDFGIVRPERGEAELTRTGAVMGTWGYMSPEQRADASRVDARGDIYALGAMLYALLRNKPPVDLFAARQDPSLLGGIPEPLTEVILSATAYHAEDRPQDVAAFLEMLEHARWALPLPQGDERQIRPAVTVDPLPDAPQGIPDGYVSAHSFLGRTLAWEGSTRIGLALILGSAMLVGSLALLLVVTFDPSRRAQAPTASVGQAAPVEREVPAEQVGGRGVEPALKVASRDVVQEAPERAVDAAPEPRRPAPLLQDCLSVYHVNQPFKAGQAESNTVVVSSCRENRSPLVVHYRPVPGVWTPVTMKPASGNFAAHLKLPEATREVAWYVTSKGTTGLGSKQAPILTEVR